MKAAVLDEDFVGAHARDNDSGEVNAGDAAFQRLGVNNRSLVVIAAQPASETADELEVGVIAGHGEDPVVWEMPFSFGCAQYHLVGGDFFHRTVEIGVDLSGLDAV